MRYAFESGLPDPGLKQAFILDFLTGAAAAACLVQIIAPERIDDWGLPGRTFVAMRPHFWPIADKEEAGKTSGDGRLVSVYVWRVEIRWICTKWCICTDDNRTAVTSRDLAG